MKIVSFLFLLGAAAAVRRLDDETTACETETDLVVSNATGVPQQQALIDMDMERIRGDCFVKDDFNQCIGAINATYVDGFTTACESAGGVVHTIKDIKVNCVPDKGKPVFIQYEAVPRCVGASCDDDFKESHEENYLDELNDQAEDMYGDGHCGTVTSAGVMAGGLFGILVSALFMA